MTLLSFSSYFFAVVPGCLGRKKIAQHLSGLSLWSRPCCLPAVLNAYAGEFYAAVGVTQEIADSVGTYCKWMIIGFPVDDRGPRGIFVCVLLRAVRPSTVADGCGVDMLTSYVFIYHLNLGTLGWPSPRSPSRRRASCMVLPRTLLWSVARLARHADA